MEDAFPALLLPAPASAVHARHHRSSLGNSHTSSTCPKRQARPATRDESDRDRPPPPPHCARTREASQHRPPQRPAPENPAPGHFATTFPLPSALRSLPYKEAIMIAALYFPRVAGRRRGSHFERPSVVRLQRARTRRPRDCAACLARPVRDGEG